MKARNILIVSTLALALLALTGCRGEQYEQGVVPGEPTYVNFEINLESIETYGATRTSDVANVLIASGNGAAHHGGADSTAHHNYNSVVGSNSALSGHSTRADAEATDPEQKIQNLRVYVFGGGVLESTGEIALNAGNVGVSCFAAKTGPKVVYAVANPRADMVFSVGTTMGEFKKRAVEASASTIAAADKFVMVGNTTVVLHKRSQSEAIASPVPITVSRAAAKVQLKFNPTTISLAPGILGTFSDVTYIVGQSNLSMYLSRSADELTPKGDDNSQVDYNGDGSFDHLYGFYWPASIGAAADWSTANGAIYVPENVNETPCMGNTTYVVLGFKFTPDITTIKGTNKVLDPATGTFYGVKNGAATDIYADLTEATDAAQALGVEVKTFDKGYSYYRINLRNPKVIGSKTEIYSVIRNNFYKVNITHINNLGSTTTNDPDLIQPIDPESPLEVETHISASIIVQPWVQMVMDEPLG